MDVSRVRRKLHQGFLNASQRVTDHPPYLAAWLVHLANALHLVQLVE